MASPTHENSTEPPPATCCGEGGVWARKGEPLTLGCQLCPRSPGYWRTNWADSRPYQPATLDQAYGTDR
jgi:hypothetical protein